MKIKNFLILIFIFFNLFLLSPTVNALTENYCWYKDECTKDINRVFIPASQNTEVYETCRGLIIDKNQFNNIGFCRYKDNNIKTIISIGSKNSFKGIADFISFFYSYAIKTGVVLAVIMIIIAGFQWLMSAGSSEIISLAKQRIYKAIIGLIILLGSYTLLYTINPELIKLKKIKPYLINKISADAKIFYVAHRPDINKLYKLNVSTKSENSDAFSNDYQFYIYIKNKLKKDKSIIGEEIKQANQILPCGQAYLNADNANIYIGNFCSSNNKICVGNFQEGFSCQTGKLSGYILGNIHETTILDNNLEVKVICQDNATIKKLAVLDVEDIDQGDYKQKYLFSPNDVNYNKAKEICSGKGGAKYIYFQGEINEDYAIDDYYDIGIQTNYKVPKQSNKFIEPAHLTGSVNLDKVAKSILNKDSIISDLTDLNLEQRKILFINDKFTKYLIPAELLKAGIQCNLHIFKTEFPPR